MIVSLLVPLVFHGGAPETYAKFIAGTFGLDLIAQIDHTPVIPRLEGERNRKALSSFIPPFYYSFSPGKTIGALKGRFFSPYWSGCENPDDGYRGTRMLLNVHDEIVFELKDGENEVIEPIRHLMEDALPMKVPVEVDAKVGENWNEMTAVAR